MTDDAETLDSTQKPAKRDSSDADILSVARKRFNTANGAYSETRTNELDDLKFSAGSSDNGWQWPTDVAATRTSGDSVSARPMLTVNQLPQHIKQVTNDQRQNRPAGQVIPANGDADVAVAEVYDGVIRHIEDISDADVVYDTASENQVTFGEGYWRILTKYADPESFDQDIFLEMIENSFSVYLDPMAKGPCGEGAKWGFITEDLTKEEYESQFPDASPISSLQAFGTGDGSLAGWLSGEIIRIAEYFRVVTTRQTLYLFRDGKTAFKGTPEEAVYRKHLGEPIKERQSERDTVKWYKINGYEILEERDWPGDEIPIIRVTGNKFVVEGRTYYSGIVRNAKDPQRMYNYWTSQEAEMLALAPKAPYVGYAGQFEGYEEQWKTANIKNHPYLQANPVVDEQSGQVLPLPQRSQPPMVQSGLIAAKQAALEDIKNATGQYNASLGQTSNERSGKAILARQNEGDVATYHYTSNFARGIRYSTRQIVKLIPIIYDTERIARILGEDGTTKMVKFDPNQKVPVVHVKDPQNPETTIEKIYNPNVGKYSVRVISGPGYATKRKEALDAMAQLLQGNPELWAVAGDLFVKNMDWPGAQELAKRFAKTIDPKLTSDEDDSPALQQAKQQLEQVMQELNQAHGMLKNIKNSFEAKELDLKYLEIQVKQYDAETKRMQVTAPAMTEEQIQDIAMGTVHAAQMTGDLGMPQQEAQELQEGPPPLDPTKVMQEQSKHVLQANQHAHEQEMLANQPEPVAPEGGQ